MSRADRARWTLVVGVALGSLVLGSLVWGFAAEVFSKEPAKADPDEVLFPPNHSVLLTGEVDVICRSKLGELEVEGAKGKRATLTAELLFCGGRHAQYWTIRQRLVQ